jgi:uncharacterized protein YkwD
MRRVLCPLTVLAVALSAALGARAAADAKDTDPFELSAAEKELLDLTNKEREKEKLPPLKPNPTLFKVARAHSANMARQEKMEHKLDGKAGYMRVRDAGYRARRSGENIAKGGDRDIRLPAVMEGWMASPAHRANILNPYYTEIGLGRVVGDDGYAYYTQVFAEPQKAVGRPR